MNRQVKAGNENLPATNKQTFSLWKLTGIDYRNKNLTRLQASELIGQLSKKSHNKKLVDYFDDNVMDKLYATINKIYKRLYDGNMTNTIIDREYGVIELGFFYGEPEKIEKIKLEIDEVKSFVETKILKQQNKTGGGKMKFHEHKYPFAIMFIQNLEYLETFYNLVNNHYLVNEPELLIKYKISVPSR